jgi:hypothetical protein
MEKVHDKGDKILEVPKLIWALDLRMPRSHPDCSVPFSLPRFPNLSVPFYTWNFT